MKKLLITSLFLGSCVLLLAQKTTKIPNVYKPVRSEMYKKGWIDFNKNGAKDTYEDPTAPIDARIEDLLSQMTLEEKKAYASLVIDNSGTFAETEKAVAAAWKNFTAEA